MGYHPHFPANQVGSQKKLWGFAYYGLPGLWVRRVSTVVGKVCPRDDAQPKSIQINAALDPQKGSGKSSLVNAVFKANIQVCDPSYFVFPTCRSDLTFRKLGSAMKTEH